MRAQLPRSRFILGSVSPSFSRLLLLTAIVTVLLTASASAAVATAAATPAVITARAATATSALLLLSLSSLSVAPATAFVTLEDIFSVFPFNPFATEREYITLSSTPITGSANAAAGSVAMASTCSAPGSSSHSTSHSTASSSHAAVTDGISAHPHPLSQPAPPASCSSLTRTRGAEDGIAHADGAGDMYDYGASEFPIPGPRTTNTASSSSSSAANVAQCQSCDAAVASASAALAAARAALAGPCDNDSDCAVAWGETQCFGECQFATTTRALATYSGLGASSSPASSTASGGGAGPGGVSFLQREIDIVSRLYCGGSVSQAASLPSRPPAVSAGVNTDPNSNSASNSALYSGAHSHLSAFSQWEVVKYRWYCPFMTPMCAGNVKAVCRADPLFDPSKGVLTPSSRSSGDCGGASASASASSSGDTVNVGAGGTDFVVYKDSNGRYRKKCVMESVPNDLLPVLVTSP